MRAILIDPALKTIEEIDFSGDWEDIGRLISYRGRQETFTVVILRDEDASQAEVLYLDDNGLLKENMRTFFWGTYPSPLAGKGLIIGGDREGENTATRFTLEEVREEVRWNDMVTTGDVAPSQHHPIPGFSFVIVGGEGILKDPTKGE